MAVNEDLRSYLQGLYELPDEEYEALRENLSKSTYKFESEDQLKQRYPGATYAQYEVPRYDNILITDTGIGFRNPGSGSNYLFNKYIKDPEFNRLSADYDNRIYPAFQTTKPSDEAAYAALLAESRSNTEAQRALAQQYNALYSGKAVEGWEENAFYAKDINLPTRQNLAALVQQSKQGVDSSKQFLDEYRQTVGPRGEALGEIAQNQGPSTPVKYDEQMRQFVPNPGAGRPGEVRLKNPPPFALGPRGETTIAQAGPRGMDRAPGTYHPSNIIPLITPGSRFSDKEGYMINDPFKNSPQTGPGLSKEKEDFDPYQAQLASAAAKEYRQRGQVEDPFRSGAFG
jgi:hypothetical protein